MVSKEFSVNWVESHGGRVLNRLEKDVFPYIGRRPIMELSAPELLTVLQRIENRGAIETAHRTHQNLWSNFSLCHRHRLCTK